jgi:putative sigma-54 modulation protein
MTVGVEIFGHNMEVSDRIKTYVTKKASKLDRYLNEIDLVKVDLDYVKAARDATDRFVAQITVRGKKALQRTEERSDDITAAFDKAIDKMQRQLERYKGKHHRGRGDGRPAAAVLPATDAETGEPVNEETGVISRRKTFELVPMSEAEALEQMRLLGHDNFFIFLNIANRMVNVLYRRRDGTYGLIEPRIS